MKTYFQDTIIHKLLGRPYRLKVHDHGGSGPVIIMLHGIASASSNWDLLIPQLKKEYRCITVDLLGFGDSPKPQWLDYTTDDHVKSIHATIQSLHIRQPYILMGHSLGGILATRYARLHGRHIRRLILLSSPIYLPLEQLTNKRARRKTSVYLRAYRFLRTHKRITARNVARLARILPLPKAVVLNEDVWLPFIRSLENCIETQTLVNDLKNTTVPTTVFYGTFDEFIVQPNMKLLDSMTHITLRPLRVTHYVGKRYSRLVANELVTTPRSTRRLPRMPKRQARQTQQAPPQ